MRWILVEERLPEKGKTVLVWNADSHLGYELACIGEGGTWERKDRAVDGSPTHWMSLPGPPGTTYEEGAVHEIVGDITDERLVLHIDEQKETVAALMQHFIDGRAAVINGEVASVFYLKKALE